MAIVVKADILTQVNKNLLTNEGADDIDVELQMCLDDMSEDDLLVSSASPAVTSGDTTIPIPTGHRATIAITLTTEAGVERSPLEKLPGGQFQYRKLRRSSDSVGVPTWYNEFNGFFFLWRAANQAFTSVIEFYKNHAQDVDTIEFADNFKNTIIAGTTYYVALRLNRQSAINKWLPVYENFKKKRSDTMPRQSRIVRG